ncbi:origin recognition complex subunit 3 N-terminus-domain-containing protein [Coniochaeta sp. 2T2.1]|nr:origin recognition complex subunit 3 N-terminus-domain-containing protein [Coniochaeta sp. 2T2.1]
MAEEEDNTGFTELDHQAAFIFNPLEDTEQQQDVRPAKRRKVSRKGGSARKQQQQEPVTPSVSGFVPLFHGAESPRCVALREEIFHSSWAGIEARIQHALREANKNTLAEVGSFVRSAPAKSDKIPAAYIITGPNTASQSLLFDQLADGLAEVARPAKVVSLRSAEAPNLKAALKKIIRDATSRVSDDEEELDVGGGSGGRKYLDYDLEALHAWLGPPPPHGGTEARVVVAFQDTEAFDSGLLSDLIALMHSWRDRLRFTLLFGIATSVELFQARLLKSTARYLYGGQFDVVQASSVLESIFKAGVAHSDCVVRLGPKMLRALVERQREQVVGVQGFVGSLKYAYMCHFYANPLSVLLSSDANELAAILQPEHLEAVRNLDLFMDSVEFMVEELEDAAHARRMIEDDRHLAKNICREQNRFATESVEKLLRCLILLKRTGLTTRSFIDDYLTAITSGIDLKPYRSAIRQLDPDGAVGLVTKVLDAIDNGDPELGVEGWTEDAGDIVPELQKILRQVKALQEKCKQNGTVLRSKYSAQSRVLRTTVVAQKVQLSQDSAQLTDEDKAFTELIDNLEGFLSAEISIVRSHESYLSEAWVYDSTIPDRDVFIPQPGTTVETALIRPHDCLACECCSNADGDMTATMPATAVLYRLYMEAGALINVADLWSAYYALVGEENEEGGLDEREALLRFYQGLAELKTMGFVKQSKKKADHIAKLKWL